MTSRGQYISFLFAFCVFLGSFRLHTVDGSANTDSSTAIQFVQYQPISPTEGSFVILNEQIIQITIEEGSQCLDCVISIVSLTASQSTTGKFVNITESLTAEMNQFEYSDLINGDIAFVVDILGGTLQYSQPVVISHHNQTINSTLNISIIPLTISALFQTSTESNCRQILDLLTDTSMHLSKNTVSVTVNQDQTQRLPEVMVQIQRRPSFGTLSNAGSNVSLPDFFSYTLFLEGQIIYSIDDNKIQQSLDSFDIQFSIGHGISEIVTVTLCINPLPFPLITVLETMTTYILGEKVITEEILKATQSRLLDSSPQDLIFDIVDTPRYGVIWHEDVPTTVESIHNFTQKDIKDNKIIYVNKNNNMTDTFQFRLRNQYHRPQNSYTVLISLIKNDLIIVNNGITVTEGDSHVIAPDEVFVSTPNGFTMQDVYILVFPKYADVILNRPDPEPTLTNSEIFSLKDIENGYLSYNHKGTDNIVDSFILFFVAKKPNTESLHMSIKVNVTINPINDNKPSLTIKSNSFYVVEGSSRPLNTSYLKFEDDDYGFDNDNLIYSFPPNYVSAHLFYGELCLRGVCANSNDLDFTWRQSDMNGSLVYKHTVGDGIQVTGTSDFLFVEVSDGELKSAPVLFLVKLISVLPYQNGSNTIELKENSNANITNASIYFTSDGNVSSSEYQYNIIEQPKHGILYNVETKKISTNFTQEDIDNKLLQYRHNGGNDLSDSFKYTLIVWSFEEDFNVDVKILPVNDDPPQLVVKNEIFVDFMSLVHLNRTQLLIKDSDTLNTSQLQYIVTNNVEFGILEKRSLNDETYFQTLHFTQKDINEENVRYRHTRSYAGPGNFTDSFTFMISDQDNEVGPYEALIYVLPTNVPLTVMGVSVLEGGTVTLMSESIVIQHPYFAGTSGRVSIPELVKYGSLKINGIVCTICDFYTSDLAKGKIEYTHSGGEEAVDSFMFFIDWPGLLRTKYIPYFITILPINDQRPIIETSSGLTVWATGIITLTPSHLLTQDADTSPDKLVYQFNLTPSQQKDGHFSFKGKPKQVNFTFTQEDVNNGHIIYVDKHDYEGFPRHLKYNVTDGDFFDSGVFNVTARVVTLTTVANNGLRVEMGGSINLTQKELSHVTNNQDFDGSDISYYFEEGFQYGHIVGTNGQETLSFTQADINSGLMTYIHDAADIWEPKDVAKVLVYAPLTLANVSIFVHVNINVLNESTPLAINSPLSVIEGGMVCFNQSKLDGRNFRYTSWKSNPGSITLEETLLEYVITTDPIHGSLLLNNATVTKFSHNDLVKGSLCYQNYGDEYAKDTILFDVVVSSPDQELGRVSDMLTVHVLLVNDQMPHLKTEGLEKTVISGFWNAITEDDLFVVDSDNTPGDIVYVISSIDEDTAIRYKANTNVNIFTQADISNGNIMIQSNSTDNTSFVFYFHDGVHESNLLTFHITVQEHQLKLLTNKPRLEMYQNEPEAIINANVINTTTNGYRHMTRYVITDPPSLGRITVNGEISPSFTQIDLDNGAVCYKLTDKNSTRDEMKIIVSNMRAESISFTVNITVLANGIIGNATLFSNQMLVQLPADILILQELSAHRDIHVDIISQMKHGSLHIKYPNTDVTTSRKIDSFEYSDLKNGYIYYKWNPSTEIVSGRRYTEMLKGIVRVEGLAPGEFSLHLNLTAPREAVLIITSSNSYSNQTPEPTSTDATDSLNGNDDPPFNLALYIPLFGLIIVTLIAFVVVVGFCCSQCKHIKRKLYHKSASAVNFNRASPIQKSVLNRQSPTRPPHSPPLTGGFDQVYSDSEESSTPDVMMVQNHTQQQPMTTILASHTYLPHSPCVYEPTSSGYNTHSSQLGGASPTFMRHQESPVISTTSNYPPAPSYNILTRNELRSSSPVRKVSANRRNTRQYSSMTISSKGRHSSLTRAKDYALHTLQSQPQVEDSASSVGYDTSSLTQESLRLPSLTTPTPVNLETLINQEDVTDLYRKTHPVLKPSQYWV